MATDNRTNEPTPGQEVAAKAMWDLRKLSNDPEWDDLEYGVRNEYRKDARAALEAAARAAQGAAPVPSSGVDEGKLAEVKAQAFEEAANGVALMGTGKAVAWLRARAEAYWQEKKEQ